MRLGEGAGFEDPVTQLCKREITGSIHARAKNEPPNDWD